jgi:molybdopterin-guanine dinucleotide biosynthesis protein A
MTGLVLCGGQSRRMGTDKGMLKNKNNITWAALAYDKLHSLCKHVYVSVNHSQNNYATIFPKDILIKDNVLLPVKGPLLGLLSAYKQFPGEDFFVLACDLADMTTKVMSDLYNYYKSNDGDVFIYRNENTPEPLCGIYTKQALSYINNHFIEHPDEENYSMLYFLDKLNVRYINLLREQKRFFMNYNHPAN